MDEDVARVRAAADFVQVASEHIALKKVGRRWQGLCPFHAEKTPSFSVNAEEGLFHCFGCQASGDVITFVRDVMHLDFVEAVEWLAGRYGVELHYDDARRGRDHERRNLLTQALERAVEWYHQRLLTGPDAGPARAYLRAQRGYDRAVVEQFRLGWAPDEWDAMARALRLPDDVLRDSGLGFLNRLHRQQDTFRARVMFPIFDAAGRPVAFGGRILQGGEGPKYKNSPDSAVYSKSRTLYGLNWAKTDAAHRGEVIVCEGYTDVIAFFQAGLPRAVATCGTALADDHFRMLKNFARRIVLAYDADAAGQGAAERFYQWEQKYEVDLAVAALPAGSDPADVARDDPSLLVKAVEGARPFLEFRLEGVLGRADLRSPEGRGRAAEAAMAVIAEHPSEFVRDQYVMTVADRCRLDPDRLRGYLAAGGPVARRRDRERERDQAAPARPARPAPLRREEGTEVEVLRLAVHRPEAVAHRLEEVLFHDEVNLAAFRALASAATLGEAIDHAPPEAAALLRRLAVEEAEADPDEVVVLLVQRAARRAYDDLRAEARASGGWERHAHTLDWLRRTTERLQDPVAGLDAAGQLVAWLVQSVQEGP